MKTLSRNTQCGIVHSIIVSNLKTISQYLVGGFFDGRQNMYQLQHRKLHQMEMLYLQTQQLKGLAVSSTERGAE